ncbi:MULTISPECIES: D-amino acid dehydrogenase [Marinobacter]|jgi:D-amino-acid dehydrogenase|uniref:D-amino-acid dehydrogenase n=1 Tax=Marinobacter manganoxydans MnI7-9 TaxID=1094979 RepID=G6YUY5_9GAMM|nr:MULTISPECIES: D-amino acid dehydrogenase [Marinobacter]AKV95276.1 amino acid dehydrogenase [Marinobacter sp. CP1]EHJ04110.1 D-amino-acid dehydrogenase [Marinobacter manganoxydans MnI7-9]MCP4062433.1 D-amino acid dehydrogenase [Gammaproteobacteria bacterium]HAZ89554.1 D-amino acid dehydrogenase [Marinobacter adhaerens]|tara:strand:- start:196 stop:1449 length:1254 start_codon:yes stop_codon:yes gene_type:complete
MHILVLGAGVVGTTTAWYLQKQGHQVTVVDRQNQAGLETSYANGGQISVSHAEPWANPSAPLKVMKWLFQPDAPLLFRPRLDPAQWRWALSFLGQCTSARAAHNIRQMVNLGTYSRSQLQALRNEAGIEYNHLEKGILHFYTNPAEFDGAMEPTRIMQDLGCDRQIIDADRAVELEPALKPIRNRIAGATYTSEDESGDARMFTQNLAKRCAEAGVEFRYGTEILGFERAGERVLGIQTLRDGHHETLRADAYVLSMGSFSAALASQLGIFLNIYPAKGYSITVPVKNEEAAFNVSLTDDEYKLVYSRLGDRMRVAGTAELNGYSRKLNYTRCRAIVRRTAEVMPEAGYWDQAEFWTGLRPATPSNVPYIGKSHFANLYLNTGHGTLGWTHSCGSAAALADIIDGRKPEVDFTFSGL